MSKYAPYEPNIKSQGWAFDVEYRRARASDAPGIARVKTERDGGVFETNQRVVKNELEELEKHEDSALFVALMENQIVGYARLVYFDSKLSQTKHLSPDGWYFLGLIIDEKHRRMGIGTHLSEHRLEWLKNKGAKEVFSFVNTKNKASLDLHEVLEFEIVEEGPGFLNVDFDDSTGFLFKKTL
ncbi:MAG: GNAT family N-acetyltransferase [Bacteriovoracaceae bacterium]|nr:GNAT family N-acetyltransferase [Bacteriovoracaceae bacterium]